MLDANYKDAGTIGHNENTYQDHIGMLSDIYDESMIHPRTHEKFIFTTHSISNMAYTPRTAYHRVANQSQATISATYDKDGKLQTVSIGKTPTKQRQIPTWRSVWYSGGARRK